MLVLITEKRCWNVVNILSKIPYDISIKELDCFRLLFI